MIDKQLAMRKKVYGYIRVSTGTQAEKGYGLETQKNAIIKYCKDNDYELVYIFVDKAKSGAFIDDEDDEDDSLSKRPDLEKLLSLLNGINTIVVMNTSRLWRNDMARAVICKRIRKLNGDIISIEQPKYNLYSKNPSDILYNIIMEALDEYERLTINQRLANGRTTKAKQGYKPTGRQPFGYEFNIDRKSTITNPLQADIVRDIFSMRKDGMSYQSIADTLNKRISKDKNAYTGNNKDKNWKWVSVRKILTNKFYIGILTYAEEKYKGNHEPIIDLDTWNAVQTVNNMGSTKYMKDGINNSLRG